MELKKLTRESLEKRNISVKRVSDTLMSLSADDDNHSLFTEGHREVFDQAVDHSELFGCLVFNMHPLSHHLLGCITNEFDLEEVKVALKAYELDIQQLELEAPIMKSRLRLSSFRVVHAEFDHPSVAAAVSFQEAYCRHYRLKYFAMILAGISSTICSWFIPNSVVNTLKTKVPRFILMKNGITKLKVNETCVYRSVKGSSVG